MELFFIFSIYKYNHDELSNTDGIILEVMIDVTHNNITYARHWLKSAF